MSLFYVLGVVCSLGGLTAAVLLRESERKTKALMKLRSVDSLATAPGAADDGPPTRTSPGEGNDQKKTRQLSFP